MSVQFGRWNFEGQPPAPDYIEKVSATLAPYGPDSNESYSKGGVKILYRAFHTTKESRREKQPCSSPSGAVITWDGRLDNRADLISELRDSLTVNSTDVTIVAASYEKWGTNCLGKLIGDWSLSIWNPRERSVLLAKDPIGTRHLYYSFDDKQLTWSSILNPLVLFAGKTFQICEEYIAGWFSIMFPAAHLTPYVGIYAVPPSFSVLLRPGQYGAKHTVNKYWDFDPGKRIRYSTDTEYEKHFRSALTTAVQRRLRSDRPILAELSGGMDSSSIVCIADLVLARGYAECPRLDTISWFDDSYDHLEHDTNELHWFTKVEQKRGRTGYHIKLRELRANEVASRGPFAFEFATDPFVAIPFVSNLHDKLFEQYSAYMKSQGLRTVLSGIGGDDVTGGGAAIPIPELQDLLARGQFFALARQLNAWATKMEKSRLTLLWEAAQEFFPHALRVREDLRPAPWLRTGFVRRNRNAVHGYPSRMKLFNPLPSFQRNVRSLDTERRLQAYWPFAPESFRDLRYPYLDRDLLEFLCAIPRDQIVRPGMRRSLMKRALVDIVPTELLNRKRRPFVPPGPIEPGPGRGASLEWPRHVQIGHHMVSGSMGIIDPDRLQEALQKARRSEAALTDNLRQTLTLESWLRHLTTRGVLNGSTSTRRRSSSRPPGRSEDPPLAPVGIEDP